MSFILSRKCLLGVFGVPAQLLMAEDRDYPWDPGLHMMNLVGNALDAYGGSDSYVHCDLV